MKEKIMSLLQTGKFSDAVVYCHLAKLNYDSAVECINSIESDILRKNVFLTESVFVEMGEQERILNPNDTYMIQEQQLETWYEMQYAAYVENGVANPKGKYYVSPIILDSKRLYNEAVENLIDIMGFDPEITKMLKTYVVYREKFLAIVEEYWEKI